MKEHLEDSRVMLAQWSPEQSDEKLGITPYPRRNPNGPRSLNTAKSRLKIHMRYTVERTQSNL